jgi:hypothetical protein
MDLVRDVFGDSSDASDGRCAHWYPYDRVGDVNADP